MPLTQVIAKVLHGSGECALITWRFLGLSMPSWVLIWALGLAVLGVAGNLRARPRSALSVAQEGA